jgi:hypothetical protein
VVALGVAWNAHLGVRAKERARARIAELDAAIRTALPVGASPSQAIAFLDSQHIEHSQFIEETRTIFASAGKEQVGLFIQSGVYIMFQFDEAARMTNFSVRQVWTGP